MKSVKLAFQHIPKVPIALGIFFFGYVLWRALVIPFTYDEAYSFLYFVKADWELLKPENYMAGNNHPMNTWLMFTSSLLFGEGEFALRLPSVLAYLLYMFYVIRISAFVSRPDLRLALLLLLLGSPFLLDFFSLARGYGLMLAFSTGLIWHSLFTRPNINQVYVVVLYSLLAAYANLVSAHLIVVAGLIFFLRLVRSRTGTKTIMIYMAGIALIGLCIVPWALAFHKIQTLFFGGTEGFWSDTIGSLTRVLLYRTIEFDPGNHILWIFPLSIFLLITVIFVLNYRQITGKAGMMYILLVLTAGSGVLQHWLLGTPFLFERTALPLFVLGSLAMIFLIDLYDRKILAFVFSVAVFISMTTLFVGSANLTHTESWKEDRNTREMFALSKGAGHDVIASGDFIFETVFNYHKYRTGGNGSWYRLGEPTAFSTHCFRMKNSKIPLPNSDWERIFSDPETGNELWKRRIAPLPYLIHKEFQDYGMEKPESLPVHRSDQYCPSPPLCGFTNGTTAQYCSWLEWPVADSLNGHTFLAECSGVLVKQRGKMKGGLVLECSDSLGIGEWCMIPFGWFKWDENGKAEFNVTRVLRGRKGVNTVIKLYLWNYGFKEVRVDDVRSRISINLATP